MVLVWFLWRTFRAYLRLLAAWRIVRECNRKEERFLRALGVRAWDLRKQHEGMDDILSRLAELERQAEELEATVDDLEEKAYAGDRSDRATYQQLTRERRRLARIQGECARNFVIFGRALNASRHHDAALVEYYRSLDTNLEERERARTIVCAGRRMLLWGTPLATMECMIILLICMWPMHLARPIVTGYHKSYDADLTAKDLGWGLAEGNAGTLRTDRGLLVFDSGGEGAARAFPPQEDTGKDILIRVTVRAMSPGATAGVIFRSKGDRHYMIEFQSRRACRLVLWVHGRRAPLTVWQMPPDLPRITGGDFDVAVCCSGQKVWAYIDNKAAFHEKLYQAWRSTAGLAVFNGEIQVSRFAFGHKGVGGWFHRRGSRW